MDKALVTVVGTVEPKTAQQDLGGRNGCERQIDKNRRILLFSCFR